MSVVGLILARGGSKGIPRKNLQEIGSETLVCRCARIAKESRLARVFVYSDDRDILVEAIKAGAEPAERPEDVSGDRVTSESTVQRFLRDHLPGGQDPIMLIQCTSPFLRSKEIDAAVDIVERNPEVDSVLAVARLWRYLGIVKEDGSWVPTYPLRWLRQEYTPPFCVETGAFYLARRKFWEAGKRMGPRTKIVESGWWEGMEIDDLVDLEIARRIAPVFKEHS